MVKEGEQIRASDRVKKNLPKKASARAALRARWWDSHAGGSQIDPLSIISLKVRAPPSLTLPIATRTTHHIRAIYRTHKPQRARHSARAHHTFVCAISGVAHLTPDSRGLCLCRTGICYVAEDCNPASRSDRRRVRSPLCGYLPVRLSLRRLFWTI